MITWSIGLVMGLILLAGVISVFYMAYIERSGYTLFDCSRGTLLKLGDMALYSRVASGTSGTSGTSGDEERDTGQRYPVVLYRDKERLSPVDLETKVREAAAVDYPGQTVIALNVIKEPGYNCYRVAEKQSKWLRGAYPVWKSSLFQLAVAPIELLLRWTYLPIWAIIDFVDHVSSVYVGLVVPAALAEVPMTISGVSIVEAYNGPYINWADWGRLPPTT